MNRSAFIERIFSSPEGFDAVIIGGGADGAGIALDLASGGLILTYRVRPCSVQCIAGATNLCIFM